MSKPNTTVVNKRIVFLKDSAGWYADYGRNACPERHGQRRGQDDRGLAGGGSRVEMVFSSDVEEPGDHVMKLHRIEHDAWGATYRISDGNAGTAPRFRGVLGLPLAWLCNQTHRFIGGDHPKHIYVHTIINNK